jgi:hypothetical protein
MDSVFELNIPPLKKFVLLAMADHAHDDGAGCYPSIATLAKKTNVSRRGVQKIMRQLEGANFIVSKGKGKGGRALTTEYQITIEKGEPGSLFSGTKGRTGRPERANYGARKGEPGSPESSLTVLNREAANIQPNRDVWGFLGIDPCGPPAFRDFLEGCWSSRKGDPPPIVIGRALDAWEDTEGSKPPRCAPLFKKLAELRKAESTNHTPKKPRIPTGDEMIPQR